ncbi:MAG: hypothetical protein Q4G05_01665 [Clostridia bacterium]|nr:hypothetical protein [Clostridia bacterium]
MENKKINLDKGYILIYDFGNVKVHNYNTADYIDDQVIILEKNKKVVVIESPAFYDNNVELENYIKSLNVEVDGVLLSYHMAGGNFLKDTKKFATHNADEYGHNGGGKALIDNFTSAFGDAFDKNIHNVTDYIDAGTITLADIDMNIISTNDGYDIEIPEINSIYTHMLGSDCHSIIAGVDHANAMMDTLKGYINKDYNLILTSHYIPEDIKAVETKIAYIETIINIASDSSSADEMIEKVKTEYPNYSGVNYLEMTAGFFFTK